MWKKPNRANNDITQSYNDGVVSFYAVEDVSEAGYAPSAKLILKAWGRYSERRVGLQRYFAAMQVQVRVNRVIRCPHADVSPQDIAITEDKKQYRVDLVQAVPGVYPKSIDVTLSLVEQDYGGDT